MPLPESRDRSRQSEQNRQAGNRVAAPKRRKASSIPAIGGAQSGEDRKEPPLEEQGLGQNRLPPKFLEHGGRSHGLRQNRVGNRAAVIQRSDEHTSELQSLRQL